FRSPRARPLRIRRHAVAMRRHERRRDTQPPAGACRHRIFLSEAMRFRGPSDRAATRCRSDQDREGATEGEAMNLPPPPAFGALARVPSKPPPEPPWRCGGRNARIYLTARHKAGQNKTAVPQSRNAQVLNPEGKELLG